MKKLFTFLLVLIFLFLVACGEDESTPTPFPATNTPVGNLNSQGPFPVDIAQLTDEPAGFRNSFIAVTGRYRMLPLLICDVERQPSPATWRLADVEGNFIALGGYDRQVRELLPEELTMTAIGYWREWSGPVGCGKEAVPQQIWYLSVSEIISPSPIARVSLTPEGVSIAEGGAGTPAQTATAAAESGETPGSPSSTAVPTISAEDDGENPPTSTPTPMGSSDSNTRTPTPTATNIGSNPTITPTPTPTSTPTNSGGSGGTSTPTPTPTATNSGGNPTATSAAGGNPTPTSPGIGATATVDPNQFNTSIVEEIDIGSPIVEFLAPSESNLHPLTLIATEPVTITAVGEPDKDIVLRIVRENLSVIQQADNNPAGGPESLAAVPLNENEDYFVQVYSPTGASTNYCLVVSDEVEWFPGDVIAGSMSYGNIVSNDTYEGGIDYWCFMGSSGDVISIVNTPDDSSEENLFIGLHGPPSYGPLGDDYFDGLQLLNFSLPETGMFVLGVIDFDPGTENGYTLSLTKN